MPSRAMVDSILSGWDGRAKRVRTSKMRFCPPAQRWLRRRRRVWTGMSTGSGLRAGRTSNRWASDPSFSSSAASSLGESGAAGSRDTAGGSPSCKTAAGLCSAACRFLLFACFGVALDWSRALEGETMAMSSSSKPSRNGRVLDFLGVVTAPSVWSWWPGPRDDIRSVSFVVVLFGRRAAARPASRARSCSRKRWFV